MISWIGTIASIIGAFTVALGFALLGYVFFLVGSISWLGIGIAKKDKALAVLNAFFLTANLIGLYNAF